MFLLLLAPFLFNLTGLIDTFLTKKLGNHVAEGLLEDSISTLMIIGGSVTFLVCCVLFPFTYGELFHPSWSQIGILILSGVFYGLAAYPYFLALYHDGIENIIPLLQTIPLFSYVIGIFILGENFSLIPILLMILIVLCTIAFGRNFSTKVMNWKSVSYVLIGSVCYAICDVLFKYSAIHINNEWVSFFREHIGVTIISGLFLFQPKVLSTTLMYLKTNGWKFSFLNLTNEIIYIIGIMIVNYTTLLYPVAMVNTVTGGLQPLLGFAMTYMASRERPSLFLWKYTRIEIVVKLLLCCISSILLVLFFQSI